MKLLMTAAMVMAISGTAFADEADYVHQSFQDNYNITSNVQAGSANIDYVHQSFHKWDSESIGSQPEIGGVEFDYINDSFQDSY